MGFLRSTENLSRVHLSPATEHVKIRSDQDAMALGEDQSRIRKGQGPEIASIFRRLALMLLEQDTSEKGSIRGKRLQAGWNTDILERILASFQGE